MSLPDYPNNPTLNMTFTLPSGVTMRWDGEKWKGLSSVDTNTLGQLAVLTREYVNTTTYTITPSKHLHHLYFTQNSDITIIVNAATGTTLLNKSLVVFITQLGDGEVRLQSANGVTLIYPESSSPTTYSKGSTIVLESVEDGIWLLAGNLGY